MQVMLIVQDDTADLILKALEAAHALFDKNHAIDSFNWGSSFLSAENIQELNETPTLIARALKVAKEELK